MMDLPASFYRAEAAYLSPPEYPDSRVQIEGCFEVTKFEDLAGVDAGNLEEISIIDAGFDPETDILRIWISGWLECEPDGEWDKKQIGSLLSPEVVDCEGVDYGPDPDQGWDERED